MLSSLFTANGSQLLNALGYRTYESKNFQSNVLTIITKFVQYIANFAGNTRKVDCLLWYTVAFAGNER